MIHSHKDMMNEFLRGWVPSTVELIAPSRQDLVMIFTRHFPQDQLADSLV